MKPTARTLLSVTLLAAHASAALAQEKPLPEVSHAFGMLTALIHTADAYRSLCQTNVPQADLERYIGSWFTRNQELAAKVFEAGSKVRWGIQPGDYAEAWKQMREQDSKRIRAQVAELIAPAPGPTCLDGMRPFRNMNYELSYFPFHLKALGVSAQ